MVQIRYQVKQDVAAYRESVFHRGTEGSINAMDCVAERTIGGWGVTNFPIHLMQSTGGRKVLSDTAGVGQPARHNEIHGENHQSVTRNREVIIAVDPQEIQECPLL